MPEISKLTTIDSTPGIKRDGTDLDGTNFSDGQWVRFQRGRPKKIGGFSKITDSLSGPVRGSVVWSRGDQINIFSFSTETIEVVQVDKNGGGSSVTDLTPVADFTGDDDLLWSTDVMYDDAAGSQETIILAVPIKGSANIDDTTQYPLFVGSADGSGAFEKVTDSNAVASGGVFVSAPYAVLYGSDGNVTWSNANEPQNYTTGDAGSDRITGSKIVNGKPINSGSGAAGLLWTLDSVMKMDYVGGQAIFRFSRVGASSILAKNSVIEYDGTFYWIGVDRFYVSNGSQLAEIPNITNSNWFFDHVNHVHKNKIWAMKIPRYGEIWWFYPRGENTECSHAIIYNTRDKIWYDCELDRSSGYYSQVFRYPVMVSSSVNTKINITLSSVVGTFSVGDRLLTSSGAVGTIVLYTGTSYHVVIENGIDFAPGDTITDVTSSGTAAVATVVNFYTMFSHERGLNKVDTTETAIESFITTGNLGLAAKQGLNRLTRLVRVEPDFVQSGTMSLEILGRDYCNSDETTDGPFYFEKSTEKIDMRVQRRHLQLKFTSNELDGNYEMGQLLLWAEPGDARP
jgi:hypothetical protein